MYLHLSPHLRQHTEYREISLNLVIGYELEAETKSAVNAAVDKMSLQINYAEFKMLDNRNCYL